MKVQRLTQKCARKWCTKTTVLR